MTLKGSPQVTGNSAEACRVLSSAGWCGLQKHRVLGLYRAVIFVTAGLLRVV